MNWALLAPAGTVTLPGSVTLALLSDSVTANPPIGAAPLSATVQVDVPGAFTLAGAQDRLLNVAGGGGWMTVIVPPVPEPGIFSAPGLAPRTSLIVTGTVALLVPAAIVNAIVATVPLGITEVPPYSTQDVGNGPSGAHW